MQNYKTLIEKEYIKLSWLLIVIVSIFFFIKEAYQGYIGQVSTAFNTAEWLIAVVYLSVAIGYNIFKSWLFNGHINIDDKTYRYIKYLEMAILILFFGYEDISSLMFVVSIVYLFYLAKIDVEFVKVPLFALIIFSLFFAVRSFIMHSATIEPINNAIFAVFYAVYWYYLLKEKSELNLKDEGIKENSENKKTDGYDKNLLSEIESKDKKIDELEKEVVYLKEVNRRLNISLGEFFNLQEISKIITQILDTNELLKFVNDVLIGVTGVDKSSILLFNKEKTELYIAYSNISLEEQKESFKQENLGWLKRIALNGENGYKNRVNVYDYPFILNRSTKSIMYASLSTKNDKYGVILLEHVFEDIFSEDNLRFLTSIAAQVSIALENSSLYQQMRSIAMVDGLTGAFNRIYLYETLENEISSSNGRYPVSIALFDVDNFKKLNDTYGHLFGDKVLQTIVKIAKEKVRKEDIVARYGGEEFIIVFNHLETNDAFRVVERIRRAIENEIIEDSLVQAKVTVSFGISTYPYHAEDVKELIKCADVAMYRAKSKGKNCTVIYNQELEMKI